MYNIVTENNPSYRELPKQSNLINFSLFKEYDSPAQFRSFSVKYVSEGCEYYTVNGNPYNVSTGQYLLANHHAEGSLIIDSHKAVRGICIDVAPDLLSEVVASYRRPDTPYADIALDTFFNTDHFLEDKYDTSQTHVGQFLKSFDREISLDPYGKREFSREFYFSLSERIIADHVHIYKQLQSIPALKTNTRKELLRRVSKGKTFIDTCFSQSLDIETVARESSLSEYHFFRLFKEIYKISPHQYIIRKRLAYAEELIRKGHASVSNAAIESGFSDIFAFSKSFKKHYGYAPSSIK